MPKLARAEPAPFAATAPVPEDPVSKGPEDLIRRHVHSLWRYLRMHGATPHEAEDLAQEAFVITLQKGAADLDPAATATFLRRTGRFLFLRLRRGRRDAVLLADAVDALWARDCERDEGTGLLDTLRDCLGQLTERAHRAITLGYGLAEHNRSSRVDLAKELGLEPNGVKTLMQRVRQQLRECIERKKS
jgi:RNA polymerase sigma factor (sigma-70 family)